MIFVNLQPFADKFFLVHVVDVHIFHTDGFAVDFPEVIDDLLKSSRTAQSGFRCRIELYIEVSLRKSEILDVKSRFIMSSFAYRIGICKPMSAVSVSFNQIENLELF